MHFANKIKGCLSFWYGRTCALSPFFLLKLFTKNTKLFPRTLLNKNSQMKNLKKNEKLKKWKKRSMFYLKDNGQGYRQLEEMFVNCNVVLHIPFNDIEVIRYIIYVKFRNYFFLVLLVFRKKKRLKNGKIFHNFFVEKSINSSLLFSVF